MEKVTAFIFNLSKGGAQGVFVNVVNYLYRAGVEVDVVIQSDENDIHGEEFDSGIPIVDLHSPNTKKLFPAILKYVRENRISKALVFSPEMTINLYWAKLVTRSSFPIIARSLNTLSREFSGDVSLFRKYVTQSLIKKYFHRADIIISQSQQMADDLIENFGVTTDQCVVINNALSEVFEQESSKAPITNRESFVLYVGRLEPQKGLSSLLEAFALVEDPTVELYLVGDGSQKKALQTQSMDLKIQSRVHFVAYTSNIRSWYQRAKATVLTSKYEGFPNVLIESLACGTPVVSFDLPSGPSEIIIDDINGYLVPMGDLREFANALGKVTSKPWDYHDVQETVHRYSPKKIMPQYLRLLQ